MLATVQTRSNQTRAKNDFPSQNLALKAIRGGSVTQRDENLQAEADTWGSYLNTVRKATVEAISAKKIAQRNYVTLLAEVDTWERRLEIALNNDCEDLACKALLRRNACTNQACNLKALVEKHSVQVSTLKKELDFWENQLATELIPPSLATSQSRRVEWHKGSQWYKIGA